MLILKELGEQFQEKRQEIGISVKEVADDLKIDAILIENLEEGNHKVFKDVLELKDVVKSYAKYLGLDEEVAVDLVNDYLFEKTSKISLDDIKKELEKSKAKEKEIRSPYTSNINKNEKKSYIVFMIVLILLVVLIIFYFVLRNALIR